MNDGMNELSKASVCLLGPLYSSRHKSDLVTALLKILWWFSIFCKSHLDTQQLFLRFTIEARTRFKILILNGNLGTDWKKNKSSFPSPSGPKKILSLKPMSVISTVLPFITRQAGKHKQWIMNQRIWVLNLVGHLIFLVFSFLIFYKMRRLYK